MVEDTAFVTSELMRLAFLALVGWFLFLAVRKALRLTGVVPYPPFKSRAEYLEAALEMDIDVFIERAKATPRHVIQKEPPLPIIALLAAFNPLLDLPSIPVKTEPEVPQVNQRAGKWFRVKGNGALIRACACGDKPCSLYNTFEEPFLYYPPDLVEHAYPKAGEWWEKRRCGVNHCRPGVLFIHGKQEWAGHSNGDRLLEELRAVQCGCLEPVNYGKGEREALPTPGEPGKWFRVTGGSAAGILVCRSPHYTPAQNLYNAASGLLVIAKSALEPAYPRPDEWWDKKPCEKSHAKEAGAWQHGPHRWERRVQDSTDVWAQAAECGCLVPINFGQGDKKSGVA